MQKTESYSSEDLCLYKTIGKTCTIRFLAYAIGGGKTEEEAIEKFKDNSRRIIDKLERIIKTIGGGLEKKEKTGKFNLVWEKCPDPIVPNSDVYLCVPLKKTELLIENPKFCKVSIVILPHGKPAATGENEEQAMKKFKIAAEEYIQQLQEIIDAI